MVVIDGYLQETSTFRQIKAHFGYMVIGRKKELEQLAEAYESEKDNASESNKVKLV